jgi:hypothetical protein
MSSNVFCCESCSINSMKVCVTSASVSSTRGAELTVVKRPPVIFVAVSIPGVISKMFWSSWQAAIDIWKHDVGIVPGRKIEQCLQPAPSVLAGDSEGQRFEL